MFTGDALAEATREVRRVLGGGGARIPRTLDDGRARSVIKALMQIGANLSQSREFKDLFEDLISKVVWSGGR